MHAHGVGIGRNLNAADGIVARPVLLDGVLEERAQRVKVMTDGNVTHSVLVHAPCLIRFNSALINHAHYFRPEEYKRACQADRDPPAAVGMGSIACLAPSADPVTIPRLLRIWAPAP